MIRLKWKGEQWKASMEARQALSSFHQWGPRAKRAAAVLFALLVLLGLYRVSLYSYLLFHSLAEIFSIVIACGIFMIAWNSRGFLQNNYLLFIGIAYLFVGLIDLIHSLGYKGMGVFQGYDTDLPTQLWIAARYVEALSLFSAPFYLRRKLNPHLLLFAYGLGTALLFLSVFYWKLFPVCFVEGAGLTPFKKISEYVICLVLLFSVFLLLRQRDQFDKKVLTWVVWSIFLTIGSELAFTFYVDAYGLSNLIGHFFKIFSFYLIYKALIETGLAKPYNFLFRDLKRQEEMLHERTVQLEDANRELDAFSYSVSHDLRAPLRSIDGFAAAVLEDYGDRLDRTGIEHLDRIRFGVERMKHLVEDLLNLSRVSRRELLRSRVDLSAIAEEIVAELKQRDPMRRVEVALHPGVIVEGDPGLLRVVMENLLNNAWKFTGTREAARIEFGLTDQKGARTCFVRDNGVGFDMHYADRLFGAFQRLHGEASFPGTGIGLATVRRILLRHGGKIWAEAEAEKGAVFFSPCPQTNRAPLPASKGARMKESIGRGTEKSYCKPIEAPSSPSATRDRRANPQESGGR
jgi:signal transduction histidine kinase